MKLHRNLLFAGILAFGVAACGDDVTVVEPTPPPPPPLQVNLTPSNATVNAGEVADFAVGVSGGQAGASASWTCASSNTSVATVAQTATGCRATGVATGNASVTATVTKGGESASAGAQIAVRQVVPATVSIANVTNLAGTPQNLANVVGQINVTANVAANDQRLTRLELVLSNADGSNPQVVASQEFSSAAFSEEDAASNIQQIQLSFNTAAFTIDAGAGVAVPSHLNGNRRLSARIFVAGGASGTPAAQNTVNITLNNADTFVTQVSNGGATAATAMDAIGQIWTRGDITVTALPLMYSGRTVSSATLDLAADALGFGSVAVAGANAVITAGPPFTATWTNTTTGARRVNGIEPGGIVAVVRASVLSDGSNGPNTVPAVVGNSAASNFLRLDNAAPTLTDMDRAVRASRWVNSSWSLIGAGTAATNVTAADGGVGGIVLTRAAGTTTANVAPVANAGDLAESATDATYVLNVTATDALGNAVTLWFDGTVAGGNAAAANATGRFGVDNTPPTLAFAAGSSAANAVTVGALNYNMAIADPVNSAGGASGFDANPVQVRSLRTAPALGSCAVGAGASCAFTALLTGTNLNVGVGGANVASVGYFDNHFRLVDRAGNLSPELNRMGLADNVAPTLGTVAVSGSLAGGAPASFSVAATDNLNLGNARVFQTFGALATVEMQAPQTLGTFGTPLNETSATVTFTAPFIRGAQATDGANNPTGAFADANNVRFDVRDLAANMATANGPIAFARPVGAKATFDATWAFQHTRAPGTTGPGNNDVCIPTATACAAGTISQVAFTPTVSGPTANNLTNVPFTQVVIVWRRVGGTDWFRLNTTSAASATDVGAARTWTFGSVAFAPTAGFDGLGAGATQDYEFVAIGVDAQGDALISQVVPVRVVRP